ncbi:hypothetical protein GGI00_005105, partial [Coemansia sp. RSA 2681]
AAEAIGGAHRALVAAAETQLKAQVPFGMNVMDTLVVSDAPAHSLRDDSASTKSGGDLIDLHDEDGLAGYDEEDGGGLAASDDEEGGGLANIHVDSGSDDERRARGKARDGEARHRHRAPLLFDPKNSATQAEQHKVAEQHKMAEQQKRAPEAGSSDGSDGSDGGLLDGDLAGHIVVCDTSNEFPSNIAYLVSCIRAAAPAERAEVPAEHAAPRASAFASLYEQLARPARATKPAQERAPAFLNQQPVVILSPGEPSAAARDDLARFGNVHVVCGSPLSRADLARARIHTARSGIVLANREEALDAAADVASRLSLAGSDTTATATADAPALLSVLNIEALTYARADFFLSVEFIHRENMQFVGDTETVRINEVYAQAFLRPSFMAGRVYAPVMLDTLICQAYYNEHVLELMQRLIFSHGDVARALGMAKLSEAGIAGDDAHEEEEEGAGHVFLVEVPPRFHGRGYASLFSHCCFKHAAVPIGLYRAATHHRQPLWYVMPNPGAACVLREDDRVYLIANTRPDL